MNPTCNFLKAVVFDWAGTTVDYGSRAPALVFQKVFAERGIEITIGQARGPMGMAKREHIAAIACMPQVSKAWNEKYGSDCGEQDIEAMYRAFLPLQKAILNEYSDVIPGVVQAVEQCRTMGLAVGSSTGYTRELMQTVTAVAAKQGYQPDFYLCAEDAPRGRPAPFLLFEAAKRMDVYPMWRIVKVDDTTLGIEAGRNANCWTIGIARTGNLVGLSQREMDSLPPEAKHQACREAALQLEQSGAHYTVDSVADVPAIIREIDERLATGERPY